MNLILLRRIVPVLWAVRPGAGAPLSSAAPVGGGDPKDLHDLVVDHGEAVYRLALSVVRDAALAEDVAQDTLLKAWLALPTFRGEASLRSWIMRIAHNTTISTLRTRRALVMDPHDLPERTTSPEKSVDRRVESGVVLAARSLLSTARVIAARRLAFRFRRAHTHIYSSLLERI